MKFVFALLAAVVMLAALCQEGETAVIINVPEGLKLSYPPQGDCTCANCECKSRTMCPNDSIVPYRYCPGSFIYVCCNTTHVS